MPVRSGGDIDNPQIHPQQSFDLLCCWFGYLASSIQVKCAVAVAPVAFPSLGLEQLKLARSGHKGHGLSPSYRPDGDALLVQLPGQLGQTEATVIGKAAQRLEGPLALLVQLVPVGNFGNRPHHHLPRQRIVTGANLLVDQVVQRKLFEGLGLPGYLADVVARRIGQLERFYQELMLYLSGLQSHLGCEFHMTIIAQTFRSDRLFQQRKKEGAPPLAELVVSALFTNEAFPDPLYYLSPGQYVTIHAGRLLDHDKDGGELYQRLYRQYGD